MKIVDFFKGVGKRDKAPAQPPVEVSRWAMPPPRKGEAELLVAYKGIPWLQACNRKVSDGVAGVAWRAIRRKDGKKMPGLKNVDRHVRQEVMKALTKLGEVEEVFDHPVIHLLSNPNDKLTGRATGKLVSTYYDLVGEAYLLIGRGPLGIPKSLWPIPPHWVKTLPDLAKPLHEQFYIVNVRGALKQIHTNDILPIRDADPDDPLGRGTGVGLALGDELDTDEYCARFLKNTFFNNAIPGSVVAIEGMPPVNSKAAQAWVDQWKKDHQGADNAGKVFLTSGKTTISRLDSPLKDMLPVELRKFLMDFTRMCWGIPPEIFGDCEDANRATANAASAIFAEQVLVPRMEVQRTEYQMRLVPLFGDDIILDYHSPIPADREHNLKVATALPAARSLNEWRELQDLPPEPKFDGVYPPLAMPGQSDPNAPDNGGNAEPGKEPGSAEHDAGRKD